MGNYSVSLPANFGVFSGQSNMNNSFGKTALIQQIMDQLIYGGNVYYIIRYIIHAYTHQIY